MKNKIVSAVKFFAGYFRPVQRERSFLPSLLAFVLIFLAGIIYTQAWTGPSQPPPDDNASAPINVGGTGQIKNGGLTVGATLDASSIALVVLNGRMGIRTANPSANAALDVNGPIYQRGGQIHADYVFEPGYQLDSIEQSGEYMWKERHLKAVPPAQIDENGNQFFEIGENYKGLLEELEKAHIYIQQLNNRVKALEAKIGK